MTNSILDNYFSEEEVANFLGVKSKTLKTYRSAKKGMGKEFLRFHPPFIKYGRKIFFPKDQFHQWFEERQESFENKRIDLQMESINNTRNKSKISYI